MPIVEKLGLQLQAMRLNEWIRQSLIACEFPIDWSYDIILGEAIKVDEIFR